MGQKVNPTSLRLGYLRGWESNWFANKSNFVKNLQADYKIRKCLFDNFPKEIVSKSVIERTLKNTILTIHSPKPGLLIGPRGVKLVEFAAKLKKICNQEVKVSVAEVRSPHLDAHAVAESIATQIKTYMPYKRAVKQAISESMSVGAKGVKICISGRLAGAEIARREKYKEGRIPLHTLRADIDYASINCKTPYGIIGIKSWIFKKHVYGQRDLSLNLEVKNKPSQRKSMFNKKKTLNL